MRIGHLSLLFAIISLAHSLSAQDEPILTRHQGVKPKLGEEAMALPGEVIYSEFDHPKQKVARLEEYGAFYNQDLSLQKGETLVGVLRVKAGPKTRKLEIFCSSTAIKPPSFARPAEPLCVYDEGGDGRFDRFWPRRKIPRPIPYVLDQVPVAAADAEYWAGDFFRKDIVYQGIAGQVLRIEYREFVNDLAREAFSQELVFETDEDGSATIVAKGARIEVLAAGNEGIRYRVLKGF